MTPIIAIKMGKIMAAKRLDLFKHDEKARSKEAYHI